MKHRLCVLLLLLITGVTATAQWTQTAGPEGGRLTSVATDGVNVLAVAGAEKLYRFDGTTWARIENIQVEKVFAASGVFFAMQSPDLIRSTDLGRTWHKTGIRDGMFTMSTDGDMLYAGSNQGIVRSTDLGATWHSLPTQPRGHTYVQAAGGGAIYAGAIADQESMKFYRSTDNGASWNQTGTGLPDGDFINAIAASGSDVYVGTTQSGVYHSTDKGTTWESMNRGLNDDPSADITIMQLMMAGATPVVATTRAVYQYTGTEWQARWANNQPTIAAAVLNDEPILHVGSAAGLARIDLSGGPETSLNQGLRVHDISDIIRVGNGFIVATDGGMFRTEDDGDTWEKLSNHSAKKLVNAPAGIFALMNNFSETTAFGVFRSTDLGNTWDEKIFGIEVPMTFVNDIAIAEHNLYIGIGDFFATPDTSFWEYGGVYRSTDGGESWVKADVGLPSTEFSSVPVLGLAAHGADVVALTAAGVYHSTDNAATWRKAFDPTLPNFLFPALEFVGDRFYLGIEDTLYSSADGAEWRRENLAIETPVHDRIVRIQSINNHTVVVADYAVMGQPWRPSLVYMLDGGIWRDINDRFPDTVAFVGFAADNQRVLGGTNDRSVWKASIDVFAGSPSGVESPDGTLFSLTVSPNPMASATTATFSLPQRDRVTLRIVDPLGRVRTTVVDEMLDAGNHTIHYNADELPPGVWFYRLTVGEKTETGKLVKVSR